jgi:hypothetical protein
MAFATHADRSPQGICCSRRRCTCPGRVTHTCWLRVSAGLHRGPRWQRRQTLHGGRGTYSGQVTVSPGSRSLSSPPVEPRADLIPARGTAQRLPPSPRVAHRLAAHPAELRPQVAPSVAIHAGRIAPLSPASAVAIVASMQSVRVVLGHCAARPVPPFWTVDHTPSWRKPCHSHGPPGS